MQIYALVDPRNQEVRYVGQTKQPKGRFQQHKRNMDENAAKYEWLSELGTLELKPLFVTLEDNVRWDDRFKREKHWIQYYHALGHRLTNQIITKRRRLDIQMQKYNEQQIRLRKLFEEM